MWGRKKRDEPGGTAPRADGPKPGRLRDAMRQARIASAERTGVIVDLRDAEIARLELLNDALDPLFGEIPDGIALFDRGLGRGEPPRLWIDVVAHVDMGRDKRTYRFMQDTRYGRTVLAESPEVHDIVEAVTRYVARRIVELERALAADERPLLQDQMLFGSDYPFITPERWLADFDKLDIKPEVRPLILKQNAIRLLGLDGPLAANVPSSSTARAGSPPG